MTTNPKSRVVSKVALSGIDYQSHRSVIVGLNIHVLPECARWHGLADLVADLVDEAFVKGFSLRRWRRTIEGRPRSLSQAAEEGELTDDQNVSLNVGQALIHPSFGIFKTSHGRYLAGQPLHILDRVWRLYPKEDDKSLVYGTFDASIHGYAGLVDALYYGSHDISIASSLTGNQEANCHLIVTKRRLCRCFPLQTHLEVATFSVALLLVDTFHAAVVVAGQMDILIAEDDFISRKLLVNILEEQGHTVSVASDGEEAWEVYRLQPTRLIITDWLMPKMDGLDLVRKVRANDLSDYTYVILLTANIGQRENYFKAMEAGVDDFLAKPLDRIELQLRLNVAQRILRASSHIHSLESVLTICAYTKKINIPDEGWQTIEDFMRKHLGLTVSHGIEPEYYEKVIKPQLEELKARGKRGAGL